MINILFYRRKLDNALYSYCMHEIDKLQKQLANTGVFVGMNIMGGKGVAKWQTNWKGH